jgi:hypothetical protein
VPANQLTQESRANTKTLAIADAQSLAAVGEKRPVIASSLVGGGALAPPFSPPRRAKKLDQTASPSSRHVQQHATHAGGSNAAPSKMCEQCHSVSANYGIAAEGFRKRWCGGCAKRYGAANPGRLKMAAGKRAGESNVRRGTHPAGAQATAGSMAIMDSFARGATAASNVTENVEVSRSIGLCPDMEERLQAAAPQ